MGRHNKKRERPRPSPAKSGGAGKVGHIQEPARREEDLSSTYLEDRSKPDLNRTRRLLSCNLRIILRVFIGPPLVNSDICFANNCTRHALK